MKCDPEAEKYKTKFKKNKDNLVSVLFKLFNEEVFDNKVNKFYTDVHYYLIWFFIKKTKLSNYALALKMYSLPNKTKISLSGAHWKNRSVIVLINGISFTVFFSINTLFL